MSDSAVPKKVPEEIQERLDQWRGLWSWSAGYHYFVGVVGVTASSLATIDFGIDLVPKLLAAAAAVCLAVLGFVQPDRRYQKFVRAWRTLDPVVLRYKYGEATIDDVFDALQRGESIISEYEQEITLKPPQQTGPKTP